jgi:hypothetical protein
MSAISFFKIAVIGVSCCGYGVSYGGRTQPTAARRSLIHSHGTTAIIRPVATASGCTRRALASPDRRTAPISARRGWVTSRTPKIESNGNRKFSK